MGMGVPPVRRERRSRDRRHHCVIPLAHRSPDSNAPLHHQRAAPSPRHNLSRGLDAMEDHIKRIR